MSTEKTEKKRKFIIDVLYLGLILVIGYLLIRYALPLLTPFVVAFIIAYLLRRPIRFLARATHLPKSLVAVALVVLTYGVIGLAVTLLGIRITASIGALVDQIPTLYSTYVIPTITSLTVWLEDLLAGADPMILSALDEMQTQLFQMLGQLVSSVSVWLTTMVSATAVSLPGLFIRLLLMVISTFFLAIDYEKITGFILGVLQGRTREIVLQVKAYVVGTLFVCIWSYALIMFITFSELSIGLWIIGVERSTLIAALIAVFDILPVLGTGGIMIPWGVLSLLGGDITRGLSLLVLYLIVTVIRNIIEPKIVGKQIGLHPVLTLMSMYVGTNLFGVVGLFGLPILLSLLRYLNERGTISLYPVPGRKQSGGAASSQSPPPTE